MFTNKYQEPSELDLKYPVYYLSSGCSASASNLDDINLVKCLANYRDILIPLVNHWIDYYSLPLDKYDQTNKEVNKLFVVKQLKQKRNAHAFIWLLSTYYSVASECAHRFDTPLKYYFEEKVLRKFSDIIQFNTDRDFPFVSTHNKEVDSMYLSRYCRKIEYNYRLQLRDTWEDVPIYSKRVPKEDYVSFVIPTAQYMNNMKLTTKHTWSPITW